MISGVMLSILVAILVLVIIGSVVFIMIYNKLVKIKNDIQKAWININALLKQKTDEVPLLISTMKPYMGENHNLFKEIETVKTNILDAGTVKEKSNANDRFTTTLNKLFAEGESDENLKVDSNFIRLKNKISGIQKEISDRREYYNEVVTSFNTQLEKFPHFMVAKVMGLKSKDMFDLSSTTKT
ncbi:MAG: LemA family protein [Nanobdellota archaeon]